ncbi:MAG: hypothetical protein LBG80_15950, partial [Bacteroidales bacterium]|nr:hypothetical protein [Bacteroidales bacterium]
MKKINLVKKNSIYLQLKTVCKKLKMKKILLGIALLWSVVIAVSAQPRAIGGRLGGNVEFSY